MPPKFHTRARGYAALRPNPRETLAPLPYPDSTLTHPSPLACSLRPHPLPFLSAPPRSSLFDDLDAALVHRPPSSTLHPPPSTLLLCQTEHVSRRSWCSRS